tara:strand:- start:491 stop:667 length:177 start_codon:yes stop_codon:yes gene_type:complete
MNTMRAETIYWLDKHEWGLGLGLTLKAPIRQLPIHSKTATTQTTSSKHTCYKNTTGNG